MALTTQIFCLCLCCFLADSHLFALEVYDGEDHYQIPLGLSDSFKLYPGMFDSPGSYANGHHRHLKRPFTSDVTTAKQMIEDQIITTESRLTTTEQLEEDILVTKPVNIKAEQDLSSKKSVKIDDETKLPSIDVSILPQVNTLSIHDEAILSVKIPDDREKRTTELPKVEVAATLPMTVEEANYDIKNQNNKTDPDLIKHTDYLLIPVNALNPTVVNPNLNHKDGFNTLTPMAGVDNGLNQPMNGVNNMNPNFNNINPNLVNTGSYGNQPMQYGNSVNPQYFLPNQGNRGNPNLYTMVTFPNMQGDNMQPMGTPNNNNLYYLNNGNPNMVQPNTPPTYNLVPINNYPNNRGVNQPNNYIPNNQPNNFIPNNQPNNFIPNNQPNNFIPNNQPNNFIPNNQPNNFIPNNQPNNFIPNNQPNNFAPNYNQPMNGPYNNVPNNQPNNFIPANNNYNNQPNNFAPLNNNNPNNFPINQPKNIPYYNQPNSFNGQPNNFVPNNNFNNQPNNFVPINNAANNVVPYQGNITPFQDQTNTAAVSNNGASQPQPIVALVALNDQEDADNSTPKSDEQKVGD